MAQSVLRTGCLEGETAVVTGGGQGLGRAVALRLAELGAQVGVLGRTETTLKETVAKITNADGTAVHVVTDIRDPDSVTEAAQTVSSELGLTTVLVNNAGGQFAADFAEISDNGWSAVVDLNLNGTRNVLSRFVSQMFEAGRGHIVNVVGSAWTRGNPGMSHSGAARAAVIHLSKSLSMEWADRNININNVGPMVKTEGAEANYGTEMMGTMQSFIPMGRWGTESDYADVVAFYCTPAASFITGSLIPFDGGNYLDVGVDVSTRASSR